jgi:hypothetical protein
MRQDPNGTNDPNSLNTARLIFTVQNSHPQVAFDRKINNSAGQIRIGFTSSGFMF